MNRRSVLAGLGGVVGSYAGCVEFDEEWGEDWQMVRDCTEETATTVESVTIALEEWLADPQSIETEEFEQMANDTTQTLDDCESELLELQGDIEDEDIIPDEDFEYDGEEVVEIIDDLLEVAALAQTAAEYAAETDGEPDELTDDEKATVEDVLEQTDEVLADAEPLYDD